MQTPELGKEAVGPPTSPSKRPAWGQENIRAKDFLKAWDYKTKGPCYENGGTCMA